MINEAYKKQGSSSLAKSYRDIMLSDDSGKSITKHIRNSLLPMSSSFVASSQYGCGWNGGETSLGHLHVRLFIYSCIHYGVSGAVLFVDVVAAFACMLRKIVFHSADLASDEAWLGALRDAGFPPEDIEAIYAIVLDIPWESPSHQSWEFFLARACYTNTWFSQEYLYNVVSTA